mgnify:CR=1 FL=1
MTPNKYQITKEQYDYLLPVFGIASNNWKMFTRTDRKVQKYYFLGTNDEYIDFLNRCQYLND